MKIAEGLLLRKQLEAKVKQLETVKLAGERGILEIQTERKPVNEQVDEVRIQVPKVSMREVTKLYDHYASELRKLDASIQRANWQYDLEFTETKEPEEPKETKE